MLRLHPVYPLELLPKVLATQQVPQEMLFEIVQWSGVDDLQGNALC